MTNLLALTGGGFKGVFTLEILKQLEAHTEGGDIRSCIDVFAGTSAGSIIAAGLACNLRVCDLQKFFEDKRSEIFHGRHRFNKGPGAFTSRYHNRNLRAALIEVFDDRKLSDTEKPLIIPTVDAETFKPIVLASFSGAGLSYSGLHYEGMAIADAVLASCSAPTFFPLQRFDYARDEDANPHSNNWFGDGGMIANAPDMIAATETIAHLGIPIDHLHILSIGTTHHRRSVHKGPRDRRKSPDQKKWGLLSWLFFRKAYLIDLMMISQVKLAETLMERVFSRDRFIRLDTEIEYKSGFDMDSIDRHDELVGFARKTFNGLWEDPSWDAHRLLIYLDRISAN